VATPKIGAALYGKDVDRPTLIKGILLGAGAALFWGASPILVKMGLDSGGSSISGSLAAYTAAVIVLSPLLLRRKTRDELSNADGKSLQLALMSGMTTNVAQMLRFFALAYASVITVSVVSRTMIIFTLIFSFIFNRKVESFGIWVIIGNALLLIGTVLVIIEQLWNF
ncbi:MAG: DMT family transporter, partial [Dehalococcoidia bacterium]|nr:DMT family transporter [Dehalococcoidia bacterium]